MNAPALRPTVTHKIRTFMREQGAALPPWSGLDETYGREGVRFRIWDSCMFPLYTLHGTGHNPRAAKAARVRQRFMHKLKYFPDRHQGKVSCVGCGRCVIYCPVNIDIREVASGMKAGG